MISQGARAMTVGRSIGAEKFLGLGAREWLSLFFGRCQRRFAGKKPAFACRATPAREQRPLDKDVFRVAGSGKSYEFRRVARAAWGGGDSRAQGARFVAR